MGAPLRGAGEGDAAAPREVNGTRSPFTVYD